MGIESGSGNSEVQNQEIQQSNNEQNEINQAEHQRSGEELEGNSTIDNEGERKQIDGADREDSLKDEPQGLDNDDSIEDENQASPEETEREIPEQNQNSLDANDKIEDESNEAGVQENNNEIADSLENEDNIEDPKTEDEPDDGLEQEDSLEDADTIEDETDDSGDDESLDNDDLIEDETEGKNLEGKSKDESSEECGDETELVDESTNDTENEAESVDESIGEVEGETKLTDESADEADEETESVDEADDEVELIDKNTDVATGNASDITEDAGNDSESNNVNSEGTNQVSENVDENNSNSEGTERVDAEKNTFFENASYHQGQNDLGALGTCGPTSIANSLNRVSGTSEYTENKVLHNAMDNNLCHKSDNPYSCGGTTTRDVVNIIDNVKIPESDIHTEVYEYDKALSVDQLADRIDNPGTVAMVGVDSATLWDRRGDVATSGLFQHTDAPSDHWITVDSPIRDENGSVTGFNVIDSGGGVDYVDRDKFESMYMGDAGHTVSDLTAILISNEGEASNSYYGGEGIERTSDYKGSAIESDGGDPPTTKTFDNGNDTEKMAKLSFEEKFAEKRDSWVDDDKAKSFIETSDTYAQKSVDSGACSSKEEYYKMYKSGNYRYEKDFVDKIKEPYLEEGASSLVSNRDVINAFDNPRCQSTIGRQEHGNFVTSMKEDNALIYDTSGLLKNTETIEQIKGVDPGKYDGGVYQYSYDSTFVNDCENKGLIRTVNGDNPGSNSLNIPGCQTWSGEHTEYSESELLMPSIDVSGYKSEDVFNTIRENGYFEINCPTVVSEDGARVQVNGTFRITRLGE